jgi:hypothetical protein
MTKDPAQMTVTKKSPKAKTVPATTGEHEGATDSKTGDRTGPGVGYDTEPEQVKDRGGVA